jgi:hypothetical protein
MTLRREILCMLIVAAWPQLASAKHRLKVVPSVFDPQHTGDVASEWLPFSGPGNSDPALVMSKMLPTSTNAAAIATVEGVDGVELRELGFDVFVSGHCGAGAPRFNVTTEDGFVYFFGCAYGTHAPAPDKPTTFERVRFADRDAFKQLTSDPPWPGFGHVRVESIVIVFDEGVDVGSGFTALDNIDVNGRLVGRGPRGHHDGDGDGDDGDRD